jgi:hypothetical protein
MSFNYQKFLDIIDMMYNKEDQSKILPLITEEMCNMIDNNGDHFCLLNNKLWGIIRFQISY